MTRFRRLVGGVVVGCGLVAEIVGPGADVPALWLPDLAAGIAWPAGQRVLQDPGETGNRSSIRVSVVVTRLPTPKDRT
jgi:hypothetical protein